VLGLGRERRGIDALAGREEAAHLLDAPGQEVHRAAPVAATQMVEPDVDLEDPLVEEADRIRLGAPDIFQDLVALEELAGVEEGDPGEQARWWGILAAADGWCGHQRAPCRAFYGVPPVVPRSPWAAQVLR